MSNKYSNEQLQILVTALAVSRSYEEQKKIINDLSKNELSEFSARELSAKARHAHKQNPESINVYYLPEYMRKDTERPETKASLVARFEKLTGMDLDTLENCNRDVIVRIFDYVTDLKKFSNEVSKDNEQLVHTIKDRDTRIHTLENY